VNEEPRPVTSDPAIKIANEFTEVVVDRVQTRNGARLRIFVPSSGSQILLCPLELEALTWQDHDLFSHLLATPGEAAGPAGPRAGAPGEPPGGPAGGAR
jgi:hypothetical protein